MGPIHQLLAIFVLGALSCFAEDCKTSRKWLAAKEECEKEMSEQNACFWNCMYEEVRALDTYGRLSKERSPDALKKVIEEPELREAVDKTIASCLSQVRDEIDPCNQSKMLHECLWSDEEFLEAMKAANHCVMTPQ
ncbi:uncharacterized protein LOC107039384 [Diachasma alloeum]|uniref:uncharacterized protein LOC107039384 n=1 Tax=Diachasma alloeum TaxID=454923 RepID=UPI000738421D|nr:uncharacterized protein LOC107039384 [Diachasma alloeum]